MADLNITFEDYVESFKCFLVKGYFMNVTEASNFDAEKLRESFELKLHRDDAYYKVFNKEPYCNYLPKV